MSLREWIILAALFATNMLHCMWEYQLINEQEESDEAWAKLCIEALITGQLKNEKNKSERTIR